MECSFKMKQNTNTPWEVLSLSLPFSLHFFSSLMFLSKFVSNFYLMQSKLHFLSKNCRVFTFEFTARNWASANGIGGKRKKERKRECVRGRKKKRGREKMRGGEREGEFHYCQTLELWNPMLSACVVCVRFSLPPFLSLFLSEDSVCDSGIEREPNPTAFCWHFVCRNRYKRVYSHSSKWQNYPLPSLFPSLSLFFLLILVLLCLSD